MLLLTSAILISFLTSFDRFHYESACKTKQIPSVGRPKRYKNLFFVFDLGQTSYFRRPKIVSSQTLMFSLMELTWMHVNMFMFHSRSQKCFCRDKFDVWPDSWINKLGRICNLGPVYMRKSWPKDPGHPPPRATLGPLTIHTFLHKSKRAFTWQITTGLGE